MPLQPNYVRTKGYDANPPGICQALTDTGHPCLGRAPDKSVLVFSDGYEDIRTYLCKAHTEVMQIKDYYTWTLGYNAPITIPYSYGKSTSTWGPSVLSTTWFNKIVKSKVVDNPTHYITKWSWEESK